MDYRIGNQFAKGNPPNKTSFKKGHIPWIKGKKGIIKGYWKGKHHSKETKIKISKKRKGVPSPNKNGIFIPCIVCGKLKYFPKCRIGVRKFCSQKCMGLYRTNKPLNLREKNGNWKGGIRKSNNGKYIEILEPNHPFANKYGNVKKHRLVMEKHLSRYLSQEEVVHHINGNTLDDRIENLMLFPNNSEHIRFHKPKGTPFPKSIN